MHGVVPMFSTFLRGGIGNACSTEDDGVLVLEYDRLLEEEDGEAYWR